MSLFGSWRPSLRMARRDAVRARGRSVLVLVMIALPVLAVTAADVVIQTGQVSGDEALDRRLGQADARVSFEMDASRVYQSFDPDGGSLSTECCQEQATPPGLDTIATALDRDVTGLAMRSGTVEVRTDKGIGYVEATETDLGDPLARGMFELKEGAFVPGPGEVVINPELAERGFGIGDDLEVVDGKTLTIVGIVESTTYRDLRIAVGGPGSLSVPDDYSSNWFIDAGPVSWDDVLALNAVGATVLSRDVMLDPPPDSALPAEVSSGFGNSNETFAVALLVVVMALIEVVLLAGPAFAVGARRQARNLALMAATGGTPRQARRVVLAGAVVLGSVGAALGAVLGIGVAWAVLPIVQRYSGTWLGPFDVPWLHLVGIAGVRPAQRAAGRRRTRVDRVPPGRRRRARRPARRPRPEPPFADPGTCAAGGRHRRLCRRRDRRRRVRDRLLGDPGRARHDPAGPDRGGRGGAARTPAAALDALRRPRCGPAPHAHGPRRGSGGGHGGGGGRARHRQQQRRGPEPGDLPGAAARR